MADTTVLQLDEFFELVQSDSFLVTSGSNLGGYVTLENLAESMPPVPVAESLSDGVLSYTPAGILEALGDLSEDISGVLGTLDTHVASSMHVGIEPFVDFSLLNSWANVGGGYAPLRYAKDNGGFTHLEGAVSGGTWGTQIATLPVLYRPEYEENFVVWSGGGAARLRISTNGAIYVFGGSAGVYISGIAFKAYIPE